MYLSVDYRHVVPCPDTSLILKQKLSSNGSSAKFGQKNQSFNTNLSFVLHHMYDYVFLSIKMKSSEHIKRIK